MNREFSCRCHFKSFYHIDSCYLTRNVEPQNSKSVLFIAIQIKTRNDVWYFTYYFFVSVNLYMYKNSYVFASYQLSIPDIVRSAPSVMDDTRARQSVICYIASFPCYHNTKEIYDHVKFRINVFLHLFAYFGNIFTMYSTGVEFMCKQFN